MSFGRMLAIVAVTVALLASCRISRSEEVFWIRLDGPASGYLGTDENAWEAFSSEDHIRFVTRSDDSTSLHAEVTQDSLITIQVETRRFEGSIQWPATDDGTATARATWVISEPVGTLLRIDIEKSLTPDVLRLQVDRGGDGTIEATLPPDVEATGSDLGGEWQFTGRNSNSTVEASGATQYEVSLQNARGVGANIYPVVAIVFAVFPSDPVVRVYAQPFLVEAGDTVAYRVLYENAAYGRPDDLVASE